MPSSNTWQSKNSKQKSWNKSDTYREKKKKKNFLTTSAPVLSFLALLMKPSRLQAKIQPQKEQVLSLVRVSDLLEGTFSRFLRDKLYMCVTQWSLPKMFYFSSKNVDAEVACSRALRGYVLACQRALCVYVFTCQRALRAYVPYVLTCSRANVPCMLTCSRANVPCVLTCSRALRAYVPTCQCALRAYVLMCQRALRAYVPTCFACLRANVPCMLTCLRTNVPCVFTCSHANVPCVLKCSNANVRTCERANLLQVPCLTCQQSLFDYSGTSLKRTSSKVDTSLRRTKNFVPDEFLRNPL